MATEANVTLILTRFPLVLSCVKAGKEPGDACWSKLFARSIFRLENGSTQRFIAQRYHTTEANLHHWLKKQGIKTAKALAPA